MPALPNRLCGPNRTKTPKIVPPPPYSKKNTHCITRRRGNIRNISCTKRSHARTNRTPAVRDRYGRKRFTEHFAPPPFLQERATKPSAGAALRPRAFSSGPREAPAVPPRKINREGRPPRNGMIRAAPPPPRIPIICPRVPSRPLRSKHSADRGSHAPASSRRGAPRQRRLFRWRTNKTSSSARSRCPGRRTSSHSRA